MELIKTISLMIEYLAVAIIVGMVVYIPPGTSFYLHKKK